MRRTRARRAGGRDRRIGLALAGGGPEGAVYEIGALRALEDCLDGLDLNDLHSYVGVSAGSFVAACLANGLTPTKLARAMVGHEPGVHPFTPENFFMPAYGELARRVLMVPSLLLRFARDAALRRDGGREALLKLTRMLPVGVFDNEPIRRYLHRIFAMEGRTDDFRRLRHQLTVVAADLESGRPILFGSAGWDDVPISTAVQASTAVPGVYPPVLIEGRYCVDGALLKTVHASIALEEGVDLLLCVNPIVPVDIGPAVRRGEMESGTLLQLGLPAVLSQTFRTLVHSRMQVGMERYRQQFPDADVLLFEPKRDEYEMFFANTFSFSQRRRVAELAYESTRRALRERRATLEPILKRHGVHLRVAALTDRKRDVWAGLEPRAASLGEAVAKLDVAMARRAARRRAS